MLHYRDLHREMANLIFLGVFIVGMAVFCNCWFFSHGVDEYRFNELKEEVEKLRLKLGYMNDSLASLEEDTVPQLIHHAKNKLTKDIYATLEERLNKSNINANNRNQSENLLNVEEIRKVLQFKEEAEMLLSTMKREINSINSKITNSEEAIQTCKQKLELSEKLQSEFQSNLKEMRLKQTKLLQGLIGVNDDEKLHAEFQSLIKGSKSDLMNEVNNKEAALKSYIDEVWTLLLIMIIVVIILVILVAMVTWKQQNKAKYY